jgi:hypothetical protein
VLTASEGMGVSSTDGPAAALSTGSEARGAGFLCEGCLRVGSGTFSGSSGGAELSTKFLLRETQRAPPVWALVEEGGRPKLMWFIGKYFESIKEFK